jgi:hypothetical protein
MQTRFIRVGLILLLAAGPLLAQVESGALPAAVATDMVTPAPVSVEGTSLAFASEAGASNYLSGGLSFGTAYDNDLLARGVGDVNYAVRPSIAINKSGARMHWDLFYSPGFEFYQKSTSFSQSDHDLAADFQYRLSPHVTFTLRDNLSKSSDLPYHFDPNPIEAETGILQSPNPSVISSIADTLFNKAVGQITYQFGASQMIGVSGTETERRYLNEVQVPGLFNWSTRGGMAFYALRLSARHYLGVTYQFQQLSSHPNGSDTQIHGGFLFYTLHVDPLFSISLFGGPQYYEVSRFGITAEPRFSPAAGASVEWQRTRTSANLSFTHRVNDGGGLLSAVISDGADLSFRRKLTSSMTVGLSGSYWNNRTADPLLPGNNGHTVAGNLSLQRAIGEHLSLQLGYTRAHESYSNLPLVSSVPDRNRAWAAISYTFSKPLGR